MLFDEQFKGKDINQLTTEVIDPKTGQSRIVTTSEFQTWINRVKRLADRVEIKGPELNALNRLIDETVKPLDDLLKRKRGGASRQRGGVRPRPPIQFQQNPDIGVFDDLLER